MDTNRALPLSQFVILSEARDPCICEHDAWVFRFAQDDTEIIHVTRYYPGGQ